MSIVSHAASEWKENRSRSSPLCDEAQPAAFHGSAVIQRAVTPEGPAVARSPTGTRSTQDVRDYITGYEQLSALGVGFYPTRPDKSPAVRGRLAREVTTDRVKIRFWFENQHHRGFAARISQDSKLMVIDTENPFKHPDKLGPDGELFLCELLEEHSITIPPCPTVQTAHDGFHRYLLVPRGLRVHSSIGLWPGIDILAAGSNVILPGSHIDAGRYRILRSFDECPIPEAPREFINLIRKTQRDKPARFAKPPACSIPFGETSVVSRQQWWRLFRNRVFRSFWHRTAKLADTSDSAYEYHLAKACFCCGLTQCQTVYVIQKWWRHHGLERSLEKLERAIIPAAWGEVAPWVREWQAQQAAAEESRNATKTSRMILAFIVSNGPQTPASVASALPIPRERAKKAMQRMAKDGKLLRSTGGYIVPGQVGTFSCITTPNRQKHVSRAALWPP